MIGRNPATAVAAQNRCTMNLPTIRRLACLARPALLLATLVLAASATVAKTPPPDDPLPGDYRAVDGRVDRGTFSGWRLFHTTCHACHGVGGVGTDVAPNLVQRIVDYTPKAFASKVLTSYRIVRTMPETLAEARDAERAALLEDVMRRERSARGQPVMPAWESDDAVPPHVLDLYAYLMARADGAIGPGKPGLLADKKKPKR